jgi:hypothetical protein
MESVYVRREDMAAGLCALIATVPTVATMVTLANTVGELLGPQATAAIQQAVQERYALLTLPGTLDGPRISTAS